MALASWLAAVLFVADRGYPGGGLLQLVGICEKPNKPGPKHLLEFYFSASAIAELQPDMSDRILGHYS